VSAAPVAAAVESVADLTPVQSALLRDATASHRSAAYACQLSVALSSPADAAGPLDLERAGLSCQLLGLRHEALRSVIAYRGLPRPVQAVMADRLPPVAVLDVSGLDAIARGRRCAACKESELRRGFDPERTPLFRVLFLRQSLKQALMLWTWHPAVLDRFSLDRLLADFQIYDTRLARGADPEALALEARARAAAGPRFHDWVRSELARRPPRLPPAGEKPNLETLAIRPPALALPEPLGADPAERRLTLAPAATAALAAAEAAGAALPALVQAAWGLVLQRATGRREALYQIVCEPEIPAGQPASFPDRPVGQCLSLASMRFQARPEDTAAAYIAAVEAARRAAPTTARLGPTEAGLGGLRPGKHGPESFGAGEPGSGGLSSQGTLLFYSDRPPACLEPGWEGGLARVPGPADATSELRLRLDSFQTSTAIPLAVTASRHGQQLRLAGRYNPRFYGAADVDRVLAWLAQGLQGLAEGLAEGLSPAAPRRLADIAVTPDGERDRLRLLCDGGPLTIPPDATLVSLLADRLAEAPEAVALVAGGRERSRADLDRASAAVAGRLREAGVRPGSRVGVWPRRQPELIAALLGVLRLGAAYVIFDPAAPPAWRQAVAADARLAALLAVGGEAVFQLPGESKQILVDDDIWSAAGEAPAQTGSTADASDVQAVADAEPATAPGPDDAVYLSYPPPASADPLPVKLPAPPPADGPALLPADRPTPSPADPAGFANLSGLADPAGPAPNPAFLSAVSAGPAVFRPGAVISHRAVVAFCLNPALDSWFADGARVLSLTPPAAIHFAAAWLAPLTRGRPLILADDAEAAQPDAFEALLWASQATTLQTTPALLDAVTADPERLGVLVGLRVIALGGEPFKPNLLRRLAPYTRASWQYGYVTSDLAGWATLGELSDPDRLDSGRPLAGGRAAVLDDGRLCAIGEVGNLCLGGDTLSCGRWRPLQTEPETKEAAWDQTGFTQADGWRLLQTGQLACWLPSGRLALVGRPTGRG
jgi:non-ribosomal peptide synthetase component F